MDELLTPVSTTYRAGSLQEEPLLQEVKKADITAAKPKQPPRQPFAATSAEESLATLRNEPDYDTLIYVLRYLLSDKVSVDVRQPGPVSAQIVQVLVTSILPNYWAVLAEDQDDEATKSHKKGGKATDSDLLLRCLRSITGLSAILVRLRALLAEAKAATAKEPANSATWQLKMLLEVTSGLLLTDSSVSKMWSVSVAGTAESPKRRPLTQEFVRLLGGGRIVSLAAESELILKEKLGPEKAITSWIASGREYCRWLVREIIQWSLRDSKAEEPEGLPLRGDLLAKALHLGYQDEAISTLVTDLLLSDAAGSDKVYTALMSRLPAHEQKKIVFSVAKYISDTYLLSVTGDSPSEDANLVSAAAGLLQQAAGNGQVQLEHLVSVLLADPTFGVNNGVGIRRAALAVISRDRKLLSNTLEKSMEQFSDQLYIRHSPTLQQDAKAQVLLLAAGYVHRSNPRMLTSLLRSRSYLEAVSNRLGASQNRARFLGMVVGEALSGLVDDKAKKLDFHMEEMESEEAVWYKGLVHVSDTVGSIEPLRLRSKKSDVGRAPQQPKSQLQKIAPKAVKRPPPKIPQKTGFVIEEVDDDDEEDEDDDLVPYAKPDSDADDSDDDPEVMRRDKPKAPVYVRDLITYFQDTENYDRQRLALMTAPVLIRRKASFGTEVQQHASDLASILTSLRDTFEMDDFYQLRLQGLVALVVAQPKITGPQLSLAFYTGDYSLAQRAAILTALGLGAREMAGLETSDYASAAAFPSKQLPDRVERLYLPQADSGLGLPASASLKALPAGALDSVADSLTASFLGPIAAKAADEATGPDVLKLASFKSRLQKDSNGQPIKKNKVVARAKANTMAPILAAKIFFPLTARFQMALQSSSGARLGRFLFDPSLLSLYLKTLAVVLHATGPSAVALPDMTTELWDLLLGSSVQAHCVGDAVVTHAVLFALLALLDVNENRMRDLCRNNARQVVQTRDWALQVLQNTRGEDSGGSGQENEIQMLAAGTYLRLSEGMENYRSFLLGEMVG